MWLCWEQVHDSMQPYVVSIRDDVCLSLLIFYGYTLHQLHRKQLSNQKSAPCLHDRNIPVTVPELGVGIII